MSEHFDHAKNELAVIRDTGGLDAEVSSAHSAYAQTHAMLAIAEQLRISNLIALGLLTVDEVPETCEVGLIRTDVDDAVSCPDIAAALGIEVQE